VNALRHLESVIQRQGLGSERAPCSHGTFGKQPSVVHHTRVAAFIHLQHSVIDIIVKANNTSRLKLAYSSGLTSLTALLIAAPFWVSLRLQFID
jgi:hypothetical protein